MTTKPELIYELKESTDEIEIWKDLSNNLYGLIKFDPQFNILFGDTDQLLKLQQIFCFTPNKQDMMPGTYYLSDIDIRQSRFDSKEYDVMCGMIELSLSEKQFAKARSFLEMITHNRVVEKYLYQESQVNY
jgi:hypothetical protein